MEGNILLALIAVFLVAYSLLVEQARLNNAVCESLALTKWYAQEHVMLCLIPAFFIARAIGAKANKSIAYGVASTSGMPLAVCSCTVLPLIASPADAQLGYGKD